MKKIEKSTISKSNGNKIKRTIKKSEPTQTPPKEVDLIGGLAQTRHSWSIEEQAVLDKEQMLDYAYDSIQSDLNDQEGEIFSKLAKDAAHRHNKAYAVVVTSGSTPEELQAAFKLSKGIPGVEELKKQAKGYKDKVMQLIKEYLGTDQEVTYRETMIRVAEFLTSDQDGHSPKTNKFRLLIRCIKSFLFDPQTLQSFLSHSNHFNSKSVYGLLESLEFFFDGMMHDDPKAELRLFTLQNSGHLLDGLDLIDFHNIYTQELQLKKAEEAILNNKG